MKNFTLIIFFVLVILNTQAQGYLINFAGTGATTVVGTVKIDNLTSGATVTLNGGDILHLSETVGIGSVNFDNSALQICPNPMAEQATMIFKALENGSAVISIVDLSGKTVYQTDAFLSYGMQSFRIAGINKGIYFVKVSGNSYFYSAKLISQGNRQNEAGIEYISSVQNTASNPLKSAASIIEMPYTDGDQLLFKGISGQYSTIVPDVPTGNKTIAFAFAACTDADNNHYAIVQIGDQTWMAENLNVGVRIDGNQEQTNNSIIEKYCNNDLESNCNIYGGLYQWNEMMQFVTTAGVKGICPTGWHIPKDSEWTTATTFLGGESVAGGKMKSTGTIEAGTGLWYSPNTGATNESGFTAVSAGTRSSDGTFGGIGYGGVWWSSSVGSISNAWYRTMGYAYSDVGTGDGSGYNGFSVRCLRDL